jgi:hypothetical protein
VDNTPHRKENGILESERILHESEKRLSSAEIRKDLAKADRILLRHHGNDIIQAVLLDQASEDSKLIRIARRG